MDPQMPPMGDAAAAAGMATALAGMMVFIVIGLCVGYVINGVIMSALCRKLDEANPWLPWVPIVGMIVPQFQYAQVSMWWLLLIVASFIPVIGIVASLGLTAVMVYCWWRISERRGKEGWLGVLTLIPIIGQIGIPAYLAFSD